MGVGAFERIPRDPTVREGTLVTIRSLAMDYFITFATYGERVHGDARGSVDGFRNIVGSPRVESDLKREAAERALLKSQVTRLNEVQRATVVEAIESACSYKGWVLHAVNVRTNHVHIVVSAETRPEIVMNTFKARATRLLRDRAMVMPSARVWARHGSTRYLWTDQDVVDALTYVLDAQGADLGGVRGPSDDSLSDRARR
jgi:REP element-mobilizing transposase RayT